MRQKSPQFNSASGGYDLVQLPTGERMEQVRERLEHASAQASQCGCAVECAVERDPAARNAEAVLGAFGMK